MPQVPRPAEVTSVTNVPYDGPVPAIPFGASIGDYVREWYDAISRVPHASLWKPGDWFSLAELCLLKQRMIELLLDSEQKPASVSNLAAEIRRREERLGLTSDGLHKLNIEYTEPTEAEETRGADKRRRLKVV